MSKSQEDQPYQASPSFFQNLTQKIRDLMESISTAVMMWRHSSSINLWNQAIAAIDTLRQKQELCDALRPIANQKNTIIPEALQAFEQKTKHIQSPELTILRALIRDYKGSDQERETLKTEISTLLLSTVRSFKEERATITSITQKTGARVDIDESFNARKEGFNFLGKVAETMPKAVCMQLLTDCINQLTAAHKAQPASPVGQTARSSLDAIKHLMSALRKSAREENSEAYETAQKALINAPTSQTAFERAEAAEKKALSYRFTPSPALETALRDAWNTENRDLQDMCVVMSKFDGVDIQDPELKGKIAEETPNWEKRNAEKREAFLRKRQEAEARNLGDPSKNGHGADAEHQADYRNVPEQDPSGKSAVLAQQHAASKDQQQI